MKRLGFILLAGLVLMGCNYIYRNKDYQTPKEYATEQSEYIMECVVNKDKEGLKSVFSKHIAETHDLDKEIDEFFEFIDGEIVSYDEPVGREGGAYMEYGEYIEKELNGSVVNIKTNNKRNYEILFDSYYIYKRNKDYEGVFYLAIIDSDVWGINGYSEQGIKTIGEQMR